MDKQRIDILLTQNNLASSREKARALIMAGEVLADDRVVSKPGAMVRVDAVIRIKGTGCPYVSRGGYKLEKTMDVFPVEIAGQICADIGASTGGFTDCMLQHGAKKVYAIDVGYGQLDWKLRNDERVVVMERTNARYLTADDVNGISVISVDVSFISLRLLFPAIMVISSRDLSLVTLIKPQFEAGREQIGKKGVVKDPAVHAQVIANIREEAAKNGLFMQGLSFSPITGPNGNIEYLAFYKKTQGAWISDEEIGGVVESAHNTLKKEK